MRKILYIIVFLLFTPITISISFLALWKLDNTYKFSFSVNESAQKVLGVEAYFDLYGAAVPAPVGIISQSFAFGDARPLLIKKYLEKYKSPLFPYADFIFNVSEKYGLDYGLIVAIAQCESNLCKKSPPGSYNCWGFENGETHFLSWEQALNQVAETLREGYLDQGLTTPEEIMPKYAPPSVEKGGPWAKCVNQFIEELEYGKVD